MVSNFTSRLVKKICSICHSWASGRKPIWVEDKNTSLKEDTFIVNHAAVMWVGCVIHIDIYLSCHHPWNSVRNICPSALCVAVVVVFSISLGLHPYSTYSPAFQCWNISMVTEMLTHTHTYLRRHYINLSIHCPNALWALMKDWHSICDTGRGWDSCSASLVHWQTPLCSQATPQLLCCTENYCPQCCYYSGDVMTCPFPRVLLSL